MLMGMLFLSIILFSCETETKPQSITLNGKSISAGVHNTIIASTDKLQIQNTTETKHIILVRHAEKDTTGKDPYLTSAGKSRAQKLSKILSHIDLDQIYSTKYQRTMQTAEPSAVAQMSDITNYGGFDHEQVLSDIMNNSTVRTVLIVGHSNTTANFLNGLSASNSCENLEEDAYSDLFIVRVRSIGDVDVYNLKY